MSAIATGGAVYVGWHERARDTEERRYISGHDGSYSAFDYHGALGNGCPDLEERPCDGPVTRTTDASGPSILTCPTSTDHTVCSD